MKSTNRKHVQAYFKGFTLVELLIVIVVIAILAAILFVVFGGVQKRAVEASLKSDLNSATKLTENHKTINSLYPSDMSQVSEGRGFQASTGNTLQYTSADGTSFCMTATRGDVSFRTQSGSLDPVSGACPGHGGPAPAATIAAYAKANYPTANTTYPISIGTTLQPSDVLVTMLKEHYIVGNAQVVINGSPITPVLAAKSLGSGSRHMDVTVTSGLSGTPTVNLVTDGSNVDFSYFVFRGINSPGAVNITNNGWVGDADSGSKPGGFIRTIPNQTIKSGQVAVLAVDATIPSYTTFPHAPDPATGWVVAAPNTSLPLGSYLLGTSANSVPLSASIQTGGSNYLAGALIVIGN